MHFPHFARPVGLLVTHLDPFIGSVSHEMKQFFLLLFCVLVVIFKFILVHRLFLYTKILTNLPACGEKKSLLIKPTGLGRKMKFDDKVKWFYFV